MWHHPQPPLHGPSPSPPRQNKVALQREYREKEGECFNELRGVIKNLTGQELRTRQEILRKAIDMLSSTSEVGMQAAGHWEATSTPPASPPPTVYPPDPRDTISTHIHYSIQSPSSHCHQNWQSYDEYDAVPHYGDHLHGQMIPSVSSMDSTLQANLPAGMDWYSYWFNCALEEYPELN